VTPDPEEGWVEGVEHHFADLGGIRLHYVEAGAGPLVVLLHGFPDFWYSWRHQIAELVKAGFRVVAPDLPGYNRSDKPRRVDSYRDDVVADDIADLVEHLGDDNVSVVGHDWGGAIAWIFAMRHHEILDRIVVMNCPHPVTFAKAIGDPRQLIKSWYIGFFQLPLVPEMALSANRYAAVRRLYPTSSDGFTELDVERYLEAAERSERFRGGLNYYRAAARRNPMRPRDDLRSVDRPGLVIWGDEDAALKRELAEVSPRWGPNVRVEHIPSVGHWVHHEGPEDVNALLIDFLRGDPP
jgi:pimeloyl-ACP methyl ester carboxylesterase